MKAIRYFGPGALRLEDVPKPAGAPDNLVARVLCCAICGTDVKLYTQGNPRFKEGQIIGHEFCAEVVHVGEQVEGWSPGDKLTMATSISCMACDYCRAGRTNLCERLTPISIDYPGAFAEYIEIPPAALRGGNALRVPEATAVECAALAEPLSCAINAQQEARVGPGNSALILGGGPLGCLHVEVARAFGATKVWIAQRSEPRASMCAKIRVDGVIKGEVDLAATVAELTQGRGADVVIVTAPNAEAQALAPELAAKGGRVSLFASLGKDKPAITINSRTVHYRQVSVHGATDSTPAQVRLALDWMASGQIHCEEVITHRFPLADFRKGFDVMIHKAGLKVLLMP